MKVKNKKLVSNKIDAPVMIEEKNKFSKHEISLHSYLKNYIFVLEDYLRRKKEEFYIANTLKNDKLSCVSEEKIMNEIKFTKIIFNALNTYRKNNLQ